MSSRAFSSTVHDMAMCGLALLLCTSVVLSARNEAMTYTQFYRQIQERATQYHVPGPFKDFGKGPELGKCGIDDPWTCLYE
ncbi:hypothetical protein GCG54_00006351 [Colletotrichum gloeosporioides]|uniref:Uncharacterized protein n=1 Tax=Colletotrichum gloeosporioides TaxID=474922 RepID=A0A8H4FPJ5_COLGL|nr:uncharacterized protein GCG54_00006351 [Colletotrichum gloeosporioides]KAF3808489.1 hypothetical protein GCG54_00006351 [Colletotrichum gloeosporioides]